MTRFKIEPEEKSKLTHEEEVQKMFDKRMGDITKILQHHENGLKVDEITPKVRLAKSYIQKVIDDGFEKTKIKLIEEYKLNGVEIMTERDEHGRFVKKSKQDGPEAGQEEVKTTESITSKNKKSITDYIEEVGKELGTFTLDDIEKAFEAKNLSYTKGRISTTLRVLDVDNEKHLKLAFLKKDADGKYTIV